MRKNNNHTNVRNPARRKKCKKGEVPSWLDFEPYRSRYIDLCKIAKDVKKSPGAKYDLNSKIVIVK